MPASQTSTPQKRFKTKRPGIYFRVKASGARSYTLSYQGREFTFPSLAEAEAGQASFKLAKHNGETVVKPTKRAFAEVAEEWLASKRRLRGTTSKAYRATLDRVLLPRFKARQIGRIDVDDLTALIRDLEKEGLRPTTITAYLVPMLAILKYATAKRLIATNPATLLTSDDRPHVEANGEDEESIHEWTQAEMDALYKAAVELAREPTARADYSALIRTGMETGLRIGELLGLQWQDAVLPSPAEMKSGAKGELHVRRQWLRAGTYGPPKTEAGKRRIPLPPDLVAFLREFKMRSKFSQDEHAVFAAKSGNPLGHRNTSRRGFEPAAKRAGIEGVSLHDMRHAFASRMIERGVSATVLARLLGHETSALTEKVYVHQFDRMNTDDAVREAMSR